MTYDEFLNFLDKFEEIPSFAGRIRAANENLTRLGSGSGRAVYDIDGDKVFKVAKNPKGKAQNDEEVNVSAYDYNHDIVTKVLEYDNQNNGNWIVSEKAKKVGEKRIKELTGIPSLFSLGLYLTEFVNVNRGKKAHYGIEEKDREILDENEWVHELKRLVADHDQEVSDMGRPSTYGEVMRDGKPTIVLSDYGLSDEVYQTHYAPKKSNYNLYELVDMNRGEIYQEFTDGNEIRKAWWGFQPYNPPDGDPAFVNENFVRFVEARENFMIRRPIFNLMSLAEEFHSAVNGLQEYVNKANDQEKFYKNLVNLQEYLVEQGVYNRDQLIYEEAPQVEAWSLERPEADELAQHMAKEVRLPVPKHLGEGGYGQAYLVGDKVLKITSDSSEADSGIKLKRSKPKTIVEIYNVWKIVNNKTNKAYFALLEEFIADKPVEKFTKHMDLFLKSAEYLDEKTGKKYTKQFYRLNKRDFDYNTYLELIKLIIFTENNLGYSDQEKQDSYKFMVGLGNIKKDLISSGIVKGSDYLTLNNLGYKDGILKYFDVGGYRAEEPKLPPGDVKRLGEDEEKYSKEMTDKIVEKVGQKFNITKLDYLGTGLSGDAYDIGNDVVLKITADRSEMIESLYLKGKKLKHVADIYTVYEVKSSTNTGSSIYVIMLEKLNTNNKEIESKLNRLKYVFSSIFGLYLWDVIDSFAFKDSDLYEGNKTQIENYFKKNRQDSDFFYDLSEMAKEIHDNNIDSSDYRGGSNLGYKKDGSIGFFDIGFGNPYQKSPYNPKQLQVDEDGSAKFSTDNSIGRDDFPAYNNKDTSPSIENDLNANSAMYNEDLEYNHVDNATKDEFKLSEERTKAWMPGAQAVTVKKKCRLGGLGNTSVACNQGDIKNLEFSPLKERVKSSMPKSQEVKVKKKCQIGGLGNTSVACNQGDIKNLEFSSVSEEIDPLEAYNNDDAFQTILDGKRDTAFVSLTPNQIDVAKDAGLGMFGPIKQDMYGYSQKMFILYRDEDKGRELYNIAIKNDGYLPMTDPEETIKIGQLLGYYQTTIDKFIKKHFGVEKVVVEELTEAELMSLQDLPFKNDVEALGGKIYSVGGAVRDEFLGKESKDLDILITGIPMEKLEAMMQPYGKVDAVGKSFGVLKFKPQGGEEIDVAVPRTETATGEGGHKGFDVTSDHTLPIEKDLERRDFTVNAIAKDIDGNLIDPFGGQKDLQNKIIRVVNPEAFSDDPLRMLRAVQFASRFGFTIEPKTMEMIKANAGRINEIPPERILTEFDKIVKKGNILTGAELLQDTGLFKNIFGFDLKPSTIGRSDFDMVRTMGEFIYLMTRLAANPAELYKNQLKGDIETYKEIKALEIGMDGVSDDPIKNRSTAHNMYLTSPKTLESKLLPQQLERAATELLTGRFPKSLKELAVNGNDLMQLGFKGKEIGDKLKSLLINVYAENVRNDKEELLSLVSNNNPQSLSESKYSDTKKSLSMSKSISKDMKEKIEKYLGGGSSYHEGGRLHGLNKPKVKGKQFKGVGLGADKNGFYVYTHRARSKSKESPDKIPQKDIDFIESTG